MRECVKCEDVTIGPLCPDCSLEQELVGIRRRHLFPYEKNQVQECEQIVIFLIVIHFRGLDHP